MERKYIFNWNVVGGDMQSARPSLGGTTRVEIYRLLQFTLRDVLEQRLGKEMADSLFFEAGELAGKQFFAQYCAGATDFNTLIRLVQSSFKELGIGIFRVEKADAEALSFILTVDEDLDCSGLPEMDDEICIYDEGFIKGILDSFTGKNFAVREVDCWCTGARTCRFEAHAVEKPSK